MVQVEMVELAMNLDFEKNYLAFKKVVLFARPKMFTLLFCFEMLCFGAKPVVRFRNGDANMKDEMLELFQL